MDAERVKNWSAAIQSAIVALGIVVAGMWAVFRFGKLEDIVSLDIAVDARQLDRSDSEPPALLVTVAVKNNGTRNVRLDLSQYPLKIQRLATQDGNVVATRTWRPLCLQLYPENDGPPLAVPSWGIQPKATKLITFYQQLDGPGTFFIAFQSPVAASVAPKVNDRTSDAAEAASRLGRALNDDVWTATTYIAILESPASTSDNRGSLPVRNLGR